MYIHMFMYIVYIYKYDPLTSFYGLIWMRTERRFLVPGIEDSSWVKTELQDWTKFLKMNEQNWRLFDNIFSRISMYIRRNFLPHFCENLPIPEFF